MSEETNEIIITRKDGKWKIEPEFITLPTAVAGYETTKTIKITNKTKFQFPEFKIRTNRQDCHFKTIRNLKPNSEQNTDLTYAIPVDEDGPIELELIFEAEGSVPING